MFVLLFSIVVVSFDLFGCCGLVVICLVCFDARCEGCLGCDADELSLCLGCLCWLICCLVVCGVDLLVIFW